MTTAHQHEATLEDALDFINTLHIEEDAPDHLAELGAGTEWLAQRGLLHERRDGRLPGVDDEGTNTRIRGCRSEERRVGKEWRCGWGQEDVRKKKVQNDRPESSKTSSIE